MALVDNPESYRHSSLAGFVETVLHPPPLDVDRTAEVPYCPFQSLRFHLVGIAVVAALACLPTVVDGERHRLRSADAQRMVVRTGGTFFGKRQQLVAVATNPRHRAHPHGRTVAVAAVGMGIVALYPLGETATVAAHGMRVTVAPGVYVGSEVVGAMQQRIGHRNGADGVVGEAVLGGEKLEIVVVRRVELPPAAYNVAYNRAKHVTCGVSRFSMRFPPCAAGC